MVMLSLTSLVLSMKNRSGEGDQTRMAARMKKRTELSLTIKRPQVALRTLGLLP